MVMPLAETLGDDAGSGEGMLVAGESAGEDLNRGHDYGSLSGRAHEDRGWSGADNLP